MSVSYLDTNRFNAEIVNADNLVLVDFFATWCGPCEMMAPVVEDISNEFDYVDVYKVDIDESAELCREYDISAVPTLLLFKDGEEVERFVGVTGKSELSNAIRAYKD